MSTTNNHQSGGSTNAGEHVNRMTRRGERFGRKLNSKRVVKPSRLADALWNRHEESLDLIGLMRLAGHRGTLCPCIPFDDADLDLS